MNSRDPGGGELGKGCQVLTIRDMAFVCSSASFAGNVSISATFHLS